MTDQGHGKSYYFNKKVGIGTKNPESELDVNGIATVNKNIQRSLNEIIVDTIADFPEPINVTDLPVTFDGATNEVQHVYGAGVFSDGQAIEFIGGSLPPEIQLRTIYFAYANDVDSFLLSSTPPSIVVTPVSFSSGSGSARVAGEIHLENKAYCLNNPVFTPYDFVIPTGYASCIKSNLISAQNLVYTGQGTLINGTNIQWFNFDSILISAPFGTIYDINGISVFMYESDTIYNKVANMGSFQNGIYYRINAASAEIGQGYTFTNMSRIGFVNIDYLSTNNLPGTVFFSMSGTFSEITFQGLHLRPQSNEKVFNFDPAMIVEGVSGHGIVIFSEGEERAFAAGSLDQTDPRFNFSGNTGLTSSAISAQVSVGTSSLTTSAPGADIYTHVNSSSWGLLVAERMSLDSNGVSEYEGIEGTTLEVHASLNVAPGDGLNKVIKARLGKIYNSGTIPVTFTNATDLVNEIATERVNGDLISFYKTEGTLPAELRKDVFYYVINKTTDSFQLSYTEGGAAIDFTDDGTGSNSYSEAEFFGIISSVKANVGVPLTTISFGLVRMKTGDSTVMMVARDDSTDIVVSDGGSITNGSL
jgi:hypothetical protein